MIGSALAESETRLDEVAAAGHFMDRAYRLRRRVGRAIRWDGPADEIQLLRAFMVQDDGREEEIFSALLIRAVAAFERYLRKVASETIDTRAELATADGHLAPELKARNLINSAKLLSTLDQPRDHIAFSSNLVIERLAACEIDQRPYILNAVAFSSTFQTCSSASVEKLMDSIGLPDVFEILGRTRSLQTVLQVDGTRLTHNLAKDRLDEIVKNRNNAAHGGDNERTTSITELDSAILFLRTVCREINIALVEKFDRPR